MLPAVNSPINCGLATTSQFARQHTKATIAQREADLLLVEEFRQTTAGSVAFATTGDTRYIQETYPSAVSDFRATVEYLPTKFSPVDQIQSANPSVLSASPEDPQLFRHEANGTVAIEVSFATNEKVRKRAIARTLSEPTSQKRFSNFLAGSAAEHVFTQTHALANGLTSPPEHYRLYSTFDFANNNYIKNADCWAASLDFSGVSVNKSGSGGVHVLTAITPHHAVGVNHYQPIAGDVIYFCDANNQTVARTIQSVQQVIGTDRVIVRFTESLPSSVKKYKLLPHEYKNFFPVNLQVESNVGFRFQNIPCVVVSHYRWDSQWPLQRSGRFAYIYSASTTSGQADPSGIMYRPALNEPNALADYSGTPSGIRGGDSGAPAFFIINNELIFLASHKTPDSGVFHADDLPGIQTAIDTLGPGGQTYETVDLSSFTNFAS
jgi:hypothetical protein